MARCEIARVWRATPRRPTDELQMRCARVVASGTLRVVEAVPNMTILRTRLKRQNSSPTPQTVQSDCCKMFCYARFQNCLSDRLQPHQCTLGEHDQHLAFSRLLKWIRTL
eukprot:7738195-Pyramimonas_sp.AAC.1